MQLPPLWSKPTAPADQIRFIRCPKRIAVAATATKTGKTWGCAEWFIEQGFKKEHMGAYGWWIAPSVYQARIGYELVKTMLLLDTVHTNDSMMTITLPNACKLEFKTGEKPNLLFGQQVAFAVIDEAARMREEAYSAILTTMTRTQGPIRIASNTDMGKQNWFYTLFYRGTNGDDSDVASFQMRTIDNPYITAEAVERLRRDLPPHLVGPLLEAQFPEESANVFRNVERNVTEVVDFVVPIIRNPLWGEKYVAGLDLAKWRDYTVLTIMRQETHEVVYWWRINRELWEGQMERVAKVCEIYNHCRLLVDSTGVGDVIFEQLQNRFKMNVEPFDFTGASKQALIDRLAIGIERADLKIPRGLTQLIAELQGFTFEISNSGVISFHAPHNGYDDSVMSLALCYWLIANPFTIGYRSGMKREGQEALSGEAFVAPAHRRWTPGRRRGF